MGCLIVILIPISILCILIIPRTNTRNADAVISHDYSAITYNDEIYVPVKAEALPQEVAKEFYYNWGDKEKLKQQSDGRITSWTNFLQTNFI